MVVQGGDVMTDASWDTVFRTVFGIIVLGPILFVAYVGWWLRRRRDKEGEDDASRYHHWI